MVQKHWGFYYFTKKDVSIGTTIVNTKLYLNFLCDIYFFQYVEAVPHLKLSVKYNNIQELVWLRLGYAALQIEDWKLAAMAYRRYCALEQSVRNIHDITYTYLVLLLLQMM